MWDTFRMKLNKMSPARLIVTFYFIAVAFSTLLLCLPIARNEGVDWSFIDGLFTAVSAVSVTGLTTLNISETFSTTGIFFLLIVLQIGGVGVMTLGTFLWLLLGKKIGLKERKLIMADQNQTHLAGVVKLLKQILIIFFLVEFLGFLILGTYFLFYYDTWQESYLHGLFAAVSATTNAGFDITGGSLKAFSHDYFVQFIHILLIILGSIGFPVLIETKDFLVQRKKNQHFRFSLFTKITTIMFAVLIVFGTIIIYLLEFNHYFAGKSWHQSFFYSLFQSVTTRSAGLTTMDIHEFSEPTLLVMSVLMFIGASPSSVGGGIRTTTFALNLLFLYYFAKGNKSIKIFKREIHPDDLTKSLVVSILAIFICVTSVILLTITEEQSLNAIIFEVASAFGTTGLSMGITPELSTFGKSLLMVLMFIGRVGIISFIFMLGGKEKTDHYHYPKERIIIG